jgi:hypothetical protein
MRVHTFMGRASMDGLRQMDTTINEWLAARAVRPVMVTQTFGQEHHREGSSNEPALFTSVWYEPAAENRQQ